MCKTIAKLHYSTLSLSHKVAPANFLGAEQPESQPLGDSKSRDIRERSPNPIVVFCKRAHWSLKNVNYLIQVTLPVWRRQKPSSNSQTHFHFTKRQCFQSKTIHYFFSNTLTNKIYCHYPFHHPPSGANLIEVISWHCWRTTRFTDKFEMIDEWNNWCGSPNTCLPSWLSLPLNPNGISISTYLEMFTRYLSADNWEPLMNP